MACNCDNKTQTVINTIIHGSMGLTKSILGIGLAKSLVISNRRAICDKCVNNKNGICTLCHCLIIAKTSLENEHCKNNFW